MDLFEEMETNLAMRHLKSDPDLVKVVAMIPIGWRAEGPSTRL